MGHSSKLDAFINVHKDQLITSNIPQHLWYTLYKKLVNQTFDAGSVFQILKLDYDGEQDVQEPIWALQSLSDIKQSDPKQIYLIDHAWTYRIENAREMLTQHDALRERLRKLFNLSEAVAKEELVEAIFENTWRINNTYSIVSAERIEDRLPVWYIMDEIGSAILHSDSPNCRVVPFVYINDKITYSLLFPIQDIEEEDFIYRNFAESITDPTRRSAVLLPWVTKSFDDVSITPPVSGKEYYLGGHIEESLPILSNLLNKDEYNKGVLRVYTQYSLIKSNLTDDRFIIVENEEEADILWYTDHFKDFKTLSESPQKFINQFPFEYVFTVKDLLCVTCRRKSSSEKWLPVTYNLVTEVANFVSYYQRRQKEGLDNYWIAKPYNLARGLDVHITNNLNYILRISTTGPKIIQKYITTPVLFYRPECSGKVKFDLRYVILLKSAKPLEAYIYKNFFLRFANKKFDLSGFDDYQKHFTVMNYTDNVILKHMKCDEFRSQWEQQYSGFPWNTVEQSILKMLREVLESATVEDPPCGIAESPQSRALYAADLMLEWTADSKIQPKILEVNFTPDCQRACDYYPDFFNDIFKLLFLNEVSNAFHTL